MRCMETISRGIILVQSSSINALFCVYFLFFCVCLEVETVCVHMFIVYLEEKKTKVIIRKFFFLPYLGAMNN